LYRVVDQRPSAWISDGERASSCSSSPPSSAHCRSFHAQRNWKVETRARRKWGANGEQERGGLRQRHRGKPSPIPLSTLSLRSIPFLDPLPDLFIHAPNLGPNFSAPGVAAADLAAGGVSGWRPGSWGIEELWDQSCRGWMGDRNRDTVLGGLGRRR